MNLKTWDSSLVAAPVACPKSLVKLSSPLVEVMAGTPSTKTNNLSESQVSMNITLILTYKVSWVPKFL